MESSGATTTTTTMLEPSPGASHPVHATLDGPAREISEPQMLNPKGSPLIAFTLQNVLSPAECAALIAHTEAIGFEAALLNVGGGRQILSTDVRKSSRCIVDSPHLVARIWERIGGIVDETVSKFGPAIGLNERLRVLKYDPSDRFRKHQDGCFMRPGQISNLTLQVYLNDACVGGETTMWFGPHKVKVAPTVGQVLVFDHAILHEGTEVTSGVKYVIRTDIMYRFDGDFF